MEHLDRYPIRDRVEVHDRSGGWPQLLLAGPRSEAILAQLTKASPPTEHLNHLESEFVGLAVRACRFDLGHVVGFLISTPSDSFAALWRILGKAGARPCGQMAWEAIRIEAGWPCYGLDITTENLPQEVGRNRQAISFVKGCYLGQEVVARIESRGHVNRQLVGLRLDTSAVPSPGTQLTIAGASKGWVGGPIHEVAGRVTSAAFSPGLHATVALAYVRRDMTASGTILGSRSGPAEVIALRMEK
jgi:folate-binding protein YgfZ